MAHKDKNPDISYENQIIKPVDLKEEMETSFI